MGRTEIYDAVVDRVGAVPFERVINIDAGIGAWRRRARRTDAVGSLRTHPGHVDVVDGAAERIPVADGTVDALWAANSMHHWVDPEQPATEIARDSTPNE